MKILLIVSSFNSLTQSVFCFLRDKGYKVSVAFSINDEEMIEAVNKFQPDIEMDTTVENEYGELVDVEVPITANFFFPDL